MERLRANFDALNTLVANRLAARQRKRNLLGELSGAHIATQGLAPNPLVGHPEAPQLGGPPQARPGRFELAHGSTLFLDEIGEIEPALQTKLLRVLQDGEIQRLGSTRPRKVDVRIIAATNRDVAQALREGRLRADLYYRLNVLPITLPPPRERREDIPRLVWHLVEARQRPLNRVIREIPAAAMAALVAYEWPGNVRELQNIIDRALVFSTGPSLRIDAAFGLAPAGQATPAVRIPAASLRDAERAHILRVLEPYYWVVEGPGQAAGRLGLCPSTLRGRMQKLRLRRPPAR